MRFVTRKIHAYLDYPVAFSLIALPFVLGLGATNPVAMSPPLSCLGSMGLTLSTTGLTALPF
jgi:hypothetical protein